MSKVGKNPDKFRNQLRKVVPPGNIWSRLESSGVVRCNVVVVIYYIFLGFFLFLFVRAFNKSGVFRGRNRPESFGVGVVRSRSRSESESFGVVVVRSQLGSSGVGDGRCNVMVIRHFISMSTSVCDK